MGHPVKFGILHNVIYGLWIFKEPIKICNALPHEQFQIKRNQRSVLNTKRSHSEPVMVPKLHTSQIFKGRAYELKCRAYRFCLNKQQANLL